VIADHDRFQLSVDGESVGVAPGTIKRGFTATRQGRPSAADQAGGKGEWPMGAFPL